MNYSGEATDQVQPTPVMNRYITDIEAETIELRGITDRVNELADAFWGTVPETAKDLSGPAEPHSTAVCDRMTVALNNLNSTRLKLNQALERLNGIV